MAAGSTPQLILGLPRSKARTTMRMNVHSLLSEGPWPLNFAAPPFGPGLNFPRCIACELY
jgi:hypothetical protein